jgi:glycosyltransferase involved in cell wall biosynthesis
VEILLRQTKSLSLLIAGDGPLEDQLKGYANELGIYDHVKFLGFRKDVTRLLQMMDVFVLSSIDEGLPMAMLEAMAMRVPVIATSVGDIPKVIRHQDNGLLVEPGNADLLAAQIRNLMNSYGQCLALANNAFVTVSSQYSKEAMCRKYCSVYMEAIESAQHRRAGQSLGKRVGNNR